MPHLQQHSFTGTTDHDFTGLVSGELLTFDGTNVVSAGYSGSTVTALDDLSDVTTNSPSGAADDGKILFYNSATSGWTTEDHITNGTTVVNSKKGSAGTLSRGTPVYIVGFDSDVHEVEAANANSSATMPCIGLVADNGFTNSGLKHVISFGKLENVDLTTGSTLNPNNETWNLNDSLYVNTTDGTFTKVRPTGAATQIQRVAQVLRVGATGQLLVFNTARAAGLPNLTQSNLWVGNTSNQPVERTLTEIGGITGNGTTNYVTKWDATGSGLTDSLMVQVGTRLETTYFSANTISADTVHVNNLSGYSPININDTIHVEEAGNVGIGTTSPSENLHITGVVRSDEYYKIDGNRWLHPGNSSSVFSTFVGETAGNLTGTGNNNIGIGKNAILSFTTGRENIGIGVAAGRYITTGWQNVMIGYIAGSNASLTNPVDNVFIGYAAGQTLTASATNILVGHQAGINSTTGSANIGLGYRAGWDTGISNSIAIGKNALAETNNTMVIGGLPSLANSHINALYLGSGQEVSLGSDLVDIRIQATSIADGAVNDQAGDNFFIAGSRGSGTGSGGDLIFQVAPAAGSTGSSQNSLINLMTLDGDGDVSIAGTSENLFFTDYSAEQIGIGNPTLNARLHVKSAGSTDATNALFVENSSSNTLLKVEDGGYIGIGTSSPGSNLHIVHSGEMNSSAGHSLEVNTTITQKTAGGDGVTANYFNATYQGSATTNHHRTIYAQAMTYTATAPAQGRYAVYGDAFDGGGDDRGYGVFGRAGQGTTRNYGVTGNLIGNAGTTQNYAVYGLNQMTADGGDQYAGYFLSSVSNANNTGDTIYGVAGVATKSGAALGFGENVAGYFSATNGATNYAIIVPSGGGDVGIGTSTPAEQLHVTGDFRLENSSYGNLKIAVSDADGTISFSGTSDLGITTGATLSKYAETLTTPAGGATNTVTHNLGTTDITVQLWLASTGDLTTARVTNRTTNSVDVIFASAPGENVRVVVQG